MALICKIAGHKWWTSENKSKCVRCGYVCPHERTTQVSKCSKRCADCGHVLYYHKWVLVNEDGQSKCSVCGKEHVDWEIRNAFNRKKKENEQARLEQEKIAREKRVLDYFIKQSKVSDSEFRCMACSEVKPNSSMSKVYKRPICTKCIGKLKKYAGHLVYEQIDGYKRTVRCILCLNSEDWQDAEHQGVLLKDTACGWSYIPGDSEAKRLEADVNCDEGII